MDLIKEKYIYKSDIILDGVRKSVRDELDLHSKSMHFKKNKILFKERSWPAGVYKLLSGRVKIYQTRPDGKFQIVYMYHAGEFFGFRPLISETRNPVSAETMEECEILFFPKSNFIAAMNSSPVLTRNLLKALSYEFNVWVNLMTAFSQAPVKSRVALVLLILNKKNNVHSASDQKPIEIGREDLASFSGTTTETCVRMLTWFKQKKIISSEGRRIKILDPDELINICDLY